MKTQAKLVLVALLGIGMTAATETAAFAWGCHAQANDGTYGYSYNYPNRRAAQRRALRECAARTYYKCYIVTCYRNG